MTTIDLVKYSALILAFVGGASKFLEATRPYWDRLPPWLQRILPSVVAILGGLPGPLTGALGWADFIAQVAVPALGLLLPDTHKTPPSSGSGVGGADRPTPVDSSVDGGFQMRALVLAALPFGLMISGCNQLQSVAYPIAVECGGDVAQDLIGAVGVILRGSNYRGALDALAKDLGADGPTAIKCAVAKLLELWDSKPTSRASTAALHAREFLDATGGVK